MKGLLKDVLKQSNSMEKLANEEDETLFIGVLCGSENGSFRLVNYVPVEGGEEDEVKEVESWHSFGEPQFWAENSTFGHDVPIGAFLVLRGDKVAVYPADDAASLHTRKADQAVELPGRGVPAYLDGTAILAAARATGATAIHPGYGFLAENAEFAQRVIDAGMTFIGPQPRWLADMGDKVAARTLMQAHGFPVFNGSGLVTDEAFALTAAREIGYPVLVKPSGGGGGMSGLFAGSKTWKRPGSGAAGVRRAAVSRV